jgi:AAA15 family ATPase/GTPase
MTNHFIKNIEIKDFKCFDDFKAEGFARVNLVGGKNSVGKTAFLEACYVNSASSTLGGFLFSLRFIKFRREILNVLRGDLKQIAQEFVEQSNNIYVKTDLNCINFRYQDKGGIKTYYFIYGDESIDVNVKDFSFSEEEADNIIFIGNFGVSNVLIRLGYSSVQKRDAEDHLDRLLHDFDPSIDAFKIIDEVPQCKYNNKYLPISELGDGVKHLVAIVTSLYASENSYLFIDEIENGIHYTMLDNIWKIILTVSKELNVQVFATTHSKECIESYARVAKKLKEKDITYTILSKLKDGSIDAGVYDSKMLANTLEQDHEVRGW